jgi:hypothetical protein
MTQADIDIVEQKMRKTHLIWAKAMKRNRSFAE